MHILWHVWSHPVLVKTLKHDRRCIIWSVEAPYIEPKPLLCRRFCILHHHLSPAFLLLHLLRQDWVLHPSTQHSKEEGGQERAEAECHPGNGVGQHHFLPLPVYRLHDLIGQDRRLYAVAHLPADDCRKEQIHSVVNIKTHIREHFWF